MDDAWKHLLDHDLGLIVIFMFSSHHPQDDGQWLIILHIIPSFAYHTEHQADHPVKIQGMSNRNVEQ